MCRTLSWREKLHECSEEVPLDQGRGGSRWPQFKAKCVRMKTEITRLSPPPPPPVNSSVLSSFSSFHFQTYAYPVLM